MLVTLMPSAKMLLDLTLVPAKRVLQEMEKHALVRFTLLTDFFLSNSKRMVSMFRYSFVSTNIRDIKYYSLICIK